MGRLLKDNRGMALVLTVLIVTLIVSLTLQFNTSMRSDLYAAANLRDSIKLGYIAKSGFNFALAVLREDASEDNVDSLRDKWARVETFSDDTGTLFDQGRFQVIVSDHPGKININLLVDENGKYDDVQKGLLTRFLNSPKFDLDPEETDNIVDAIKDWIDADDDVTRFGAESTYYQGLEKPYSCENAPVKFLEDLLLVKGITKEIFYGTREKPGISEYLTPYGEDGKVNINTSDPLVLRALSDEIDEEMAEDMVTYRENEDNDLSDPNWYKSVPGMSHVNIADGLLTISSTYFEVTSKGFEGSMAKLVTGTVKRIGQEIEILSWKTE